MLWIGGGPGKKLSRTNIVLNEFVADFRDVVGSRERGVVSAAIAHVMEEGNSGDEGVSISSLSDPSPVMGELLPPESRECGRHTPPARTTRCCANRGGRGWGGEAMSILSPGHASLGSANWFPCPSSVAPRGEG